MVVVYASFMVQKNLGSEKEFGLKKFWVKKEFRPQNYFRQKNCTSKKNWIKKHGGPEIFRSKKIWSKEIFVQKSFV